MKKTLGFAAPSISIMHREHPAWDTLAIVASVLTVLPSPSPHAEKCRTQTHPQEILDTTIKHSPGAIREAVEPRPASATLGKASAVTSVASAGVLALSPHSPVDPPAGQQQQRDGVAVEEEPSEDADASCDPEAEGGSDGGGVDQVAIDEAAAVAVATAAAAEELAAAESHSLTQGAMKLVYLLAIQVRDNFLWFLGEG